MATKHKIVIHSHQPWRRRAMVGGTAAAILLSAWGLWAYTRATTISDFERARTERDELQAERRELSDKLRASRGEIADLKEQVVYLQRSQEIDQKACDTVKSSLSGLQEQVSDLQEQVAFYRGIVSPEAQRAGVRVYEFHASPTTVARVYHYDLVLIQSVRQDRRIAGHLEITLQGMDGGVVKTLRMSDIAQGPAQSLVFSFKYFEEFGGDFRLPEGFRPTRVNVAVVPDGSGNSRVEDDFDWTKVLRG